MAIKVIANFLYNVNVVITFVSILAPIFVYELIYYFRSFINSFILQLLIFVTMIITDINNDDYDPKEMENVSQWMYRAQENNFKLLIIKTIVNIWI